MITAKLFIILLAITNSDVSSDACSGLAPAATDCNICSNDVFTDISELMSFNTDIVLSASAVTGRSFAKSHFASAIALSLSRPVASISLSTCGEICSQTSVSYILPSTASLPEY